MVARRETRVLQHGGFANATFLAFCKSTPVPTYDGATRADVARPQILPARAIGEQENCKHSRASASTYCNRDIQLLRPKELKSAAK
jgi:hypothetical protein